MGTAFSEMPWFKCEDHIAGNLWYDTTGKGRYGNALDPQQLGDKDEYLKMMEANRTEYDGQGNYTKQETEKTFKVKPKKPKKTKGFKDFVPNIKAWHNLINTHRCMG